MARRTVLVADVELSLWNRFRTKPIPDRRGRSQGQYCHSPGIHSFCMTDNPSLRLHTNVRRDDSYVSFLVLKKMTRSYLIAPTATLDARFHSLFTMFTTLSFFIVIM